jgi:hypothetical protein
MIEVLHLMGLTRPQLLRKDIIYSYEKDVRKGAGNHPTIGYHAEMLRRTLADPAYMRPYSNETAWETGRGKEYCSNPKLLLHPYSVFSPEGERAKQLHAAGARRNR